MLKKTPKPAIKKPNKKFPTEETLCKETQATNPLLPSQSLQPLFFTFEGEK